MGVIFETDKRRIIPRWRSFESASLTGELRLGGLGANNKSILTFNSTEYLIEQKLAWQKSKNLAFAGDLLGSAYVLGLELEFPDVAKYILEKETDEAAPMFRIATKILSPSEAINEKTPQIQEAKTNDLSKYYPEIRKFKSYINKEPRNPIAWVELGRLYSLVLQNVKAQKCIERALYLDKNNRFIVRSASRFYHHFHGDQEALQIIKKSDFVNHDPWLISAEIAYSSILERFSKMTKVGKDILSNMKTDSFSITELASAIGTVEHSNGKIKDAKKYFKQSLIMPNDNSLAQAEWMSVSIEGFSVDKSKFNLPFAFEAKSIFSYQNEDFKKSYENALLWRDDEAYSVRPVLMAAYIAGTFLDDKQRAVELLNSGLEISSDDIHLLNDLVYFLAKDNKIEDAFKVFETKLTRDLNDLNSTDTISITATAGLLLYRAGEHEQGKEYYQKAIELAKKTKNNYLVALAMVNYAQEEIRVNKDYNSSRHLISQLNDICKDRTEPDIKRIHKDVITEYDKLKT